MDEQAVEGVADADATSLGVVDDACAFLHISCFIEIGMTHACSCLDDGNGGFLTNEVDETLGTTRNDQIYPTSCMQQLGCGFVGGGKKFH